MSNVAVQMENLSKRYRIGLAQENYPTLRDILANAAKAPIQWLRSGRGNGKERAKGTETIWALKDVSFEVKHGEVVGIIGRNGAGKSTLLKILSRITKPTEGRAQIQGRVGSLLEVGTGFHPELSGRENIYLNGAILGMKKAEIDRKFDEIVSFAEIEKFMDTPVKRYSSGMYVRLAFAVAAHLEPEILVIDEVLAVGDAGFQKKCLGKMGDVAKEGRTVLFVSHQMGMVRSLCSRAILLQDGSPIWDGDTERAIEQYVSTYTSANDVYTSVPDERLAIQILEAAPVNRAGEVCTSFDLFEPVALRIRYCVRKPLTGTVVSFHVSSQGMALLNSFDTDQSIDCLDMREPGEYATIVDLPTPFFKVGAYSVSVGAGFANRGSIHDVPEAVHFDVEARSVDTSLRSFAAKRVGMVALPLVWKTQRLSEVLPESTR